ncbi:uncharacterized protein LOC123984150 isoform X1 [Micropterus dolomieu]|uniref:uncharacterized protein LOC123984150 isoform X1 n=1 Tax=Micropterus dolomieu TaxID=147949 RepID=UPI001E8E0E9D|nr:uncharacterized protein LOC123984150 isoform X1 [Micropterus dolomieu]
MDPEKLSAVLQWPRPENRKQLKNRWMSWSRRCSSLTACPLTSSLTVGPSSPLRFGEPSALPSVLLSERANQKMESGLCCLVSTNPTTWSSQLPWVEYTHNTLPTSATGLSPFQCLYGYQPPLFPAQERDVSVPSVQAHIRRCHRTWHLAMKIRPVPLDHLSPLPACTVVRRNLRLACQLPQLLPPLQNPDLAMIPSAYSFSLSFSNKPLLSTSSQLLGSVTRPDRQFECTRSHC